MCFYNTACYVVEKKLFDLTIMSFYTYTIVQGYCYLWGADSMSVPEFQ